MGAMDPGSATLSPKRSMAAGSRATLVYTYVAGHPIDDSGYVKIAFRHVGDFGTPQFDDPGAPDYCSIRTTGDCRIVPRWDPKGHLRPWSRALYLQIRFGYLDRGDRIVVTFGDRSGGSPGWRLQTFCEHTFEFKTLVDPIATFQFHELPQSPTLRIVPGEPARAVCIAPSQGVTGRAFSYYLKVEDIWGNPVTKPRRIRHRGFPRPGVHFLEAGDPKTGLSARSNPIEVLSEPTPRRRYWADLHGQSEETIGTNTIEDYYAFGRDRGLLDICAHQGNDFQVTDAFWDKVNCSARAFCEPGRFVTFPGYEWSGNTPLGGDRNVYYKSEGGRIARSGCHLLPGAKSRYFDATTTDELFRKLRGPGPFVFAHVGGRFADVRSHDPDVEVAMEVHSAWGTFEWLVEDALRLGHRIGICANSDGHKGRPGASYPGAGEFGSLGGLTCVLADALDRERVHAAIMARHFYATTGQRALLDVRIVAADRREAIMGDVMQVGAGPARLQVRAAGTAPIESIQVRNGLEVLRTLRPYAAKDLGRRVKVVWSGAEVRGRNRMVCWDGSLRVKGNRVCGFTPINFWNPARAVVQESRNRLTWKSVTTGGEAGVILDLERPRAGTIELDTAQVRLNCPVKRVGLNPRTRRLGGLSKQVAMVRLPDRQDSCEFAFEMRIDRIHTRVGDNPVYVCVRQEDGHVAWSSPIYLARKR